MVGSNVELLENMISTVINTKYPDVPPTEIQFDTEVATLRQSLIMFSVSDDEFAAIKRKLKANIVVQMNLGVLIKDKAQHQPWLSKRRESLDFFFWNRYKKFLEEVKHWNPRVTGRLGQVSDDIIDYLGDPKSDEPFQRRGLVLGDVQSGKTANYTAICNKAADTGYRIIIVLAGMMENLRQQTQERLDAEFSGRLSQYLLDPAMKNIDIANFTVGVGRYGKDKRIASFTSVTTDFNIKVLQSNGLSLHGLQDTVLLVVKKNKSILNNLIRWLKNNNMDVTGTINLPMLLIDDEADNASVNTKKNNEDPTAAQAIDTVGKLNPKNVYLKISAKADDGLVKTGVKKFLKMIARDGVASTVRATGLDEDSETLETVDLIKDREKKIFKNVPLSSNKRWSEAVRYEHLEKAYNGWKKILLGSKK